MEGEARTFPKTDSVCCIVCGETKGLKRCGVCKRTFYCSREHQMKDWNRHKALCGKQINASEQISKVERTGHKENGHTVSHTERKHGFENGTGAQTGKAGSNCIGLPFDERPYKVIDFVKLNPDADETKVSKTVTKNLNRNGYCVIDNLFTDEQIKTTLQDIHGLLSENRLKPGMLAGGRASDADSEKVVDLDIRSDKIMWVEGKEDDVPGIRKIVEKMDRLFTEINTCLQGKHTINGRTKAMVACYPGNKTNYRRHVDNPNKDGRLCTCILYLNEGWDVERDGGLLRIFPEATGNYVDVAPLANRLLFFWCDRRNPHEVQPAFRKRFAITVWYMDKEERDKAKLNMRDAEMSRIRGEYAVQEIQQRRKEVEEVNTKLEENAARALASLSLEELKALSVMIEDVPDPHAVLSHLGIDSSIQVKLLEKLREL